MNRDKKKTVKNIIISFIILIIILFSGCFERAPKQEETMLPSLQASDLDVMISEQLSWFTTELEPSTGILKNHSQTEALNEYMLTAKVLLTLAQQNESYEHIVNTTIITIIEAYEKEKTNVSLPSKAKLLELLTQPGIALNVSSTIADLGSELESYQQENYTFNTTPILSIDAAQFLLAIVSYEQVVNNQSLSTLVDQSITQYQTLITNVLASDETIEQKEYMLHYFTEAFKTYYDEHQMKSDIFNFITRLNMGLIYNQETVDQNTLGQYQGFSMRNPNQYHLDALHQIMSAYSVSKNIEIDENGSNLKQSVILGLIYLKNNLAENTTMSLETMDQLKLILVLNQAQNLLEEDNYTYLWDASNQLLIEGRSLETSPTLWMLLTIGVMGSIGLLALLYIVIQLYYKNKQ